MCIRDSALTAAEKSKVVITVAGRSNPKYYCPCNQGSKAGRKDAARRAAEALAALPQGKGHAQMCIRDSKIRAPAGEILMPKPLFIKVYRMRGK